MATGMPSRLEWWKHVIVNSTEDQWGIENVEFCTLAASNGSRVALSPHLPNFS